MVGVGAILLLLVTGLDKEGGTIVEVVIAGEPTKLEPLLLPLLLFVLLFPLKIPVTEMSDAGSACNDGCDFA